MNRLAALPACVTQLPRLSQLLLANNKLTSLPEALGKCTTIKARVAGG